MVERFRRILTFIRFARAGRSLARAEQAQDAILTFGTRDQDCFLGACPK